MGRLVASKLLRSVGLRYRQSFTSETSAGVCGRHPQRQPPSDSPTPALWGRLSDPRCDGISKPFLLWMLALRVTVAQSHLSQLFQGSNHKPLQYGKETHANMCLYTARSALPLLPYLWGYIVFLIQL